MILVFQPSIVVLGLPADQVFTSVVEFDDLRDSELTKNVKFQASTIIPTPIESSKVDWVKLGPSAKNKNKVEVLINSINNRFIENRLDALEGIGLKAVAFEPSTVALSRAVTIPGNDRPQIIINIDYNSTEILAIFKSSPRLTRQVATSIKAMIKSMVNGLNIDQNRAEQYLYGLGLTSESDAHGQVARSIKVDLNAIKSEVKKTIDYFKNRYLNENVEKIILTGPGSRINGLAHHLANHFQLQTEIGNAWNNVIYDQQQESNLMFSSATMAVSVGLAERQE